MTYEQKLQQEAALWGAVDTADEVLPDWTVRQLLLRNAIMHIADIAALLGCITPGIKTLDISEASLAVARDWYNQTKANLQGTVHYEVADLNRLSHL